MNELPTHGIVNPRPDYNPTPGYLIKAQESGFIRSVIKSVYGKQKSANIFNSLLSSSKNWLAYNLTLCLNWFVFRPSTGSNDRLHHSYKAMKQIVI